MIKLFLALAFSFIPALFWFFFYFKRRFIPLQYIFFTFLKGIALSLIAYYIQISLISSFFPDFWNFFFRFSEPFSLEDIFLLFLFNFTFIALVEEILKFLTLKDCISNYKDVDQIVDGIQLGIVLGLGFATGENLFKFSKIIEFLSSSFSLTASIFLLRFFFSTLAHIIYSSLMGYYLALARFHKLYKTSLLKKAFFFPLLIHAFFNFFILSGSFYLSIVLLSFSVFIFWKWYSDRKIFEKNLQTKKLPLSRPFLSKKEELDVYFSKEKIPFEFIKRSGFLPKGKKQN
mgnify:CR=1 FL=1